MNPSRCSAGFHLLYALLQGIEQLTKTNQRLQADLDACQQDLEEHRAERKRVMVELEALRSADAWTHVLLKDTVSVMRFICDDTQ